MIDHALTFLKNRLNEQLARSFPADAALEERVQFPEGDKLEPLSLRLGAVNAMLINMTQEPVLRQPDMHARVLSDGTRVNVNPDVRIELWVLFAARFKNYEDSLAALSRVLRYFQANRLFEPANAPDLQPGIQRLSVELRTLSFNEQNDLWGSLRIAYHPSLLYKVGLLSYQEDGLPPSSVVSGANRDLIHAV